MTLHIPANRIAACAGLFGLIPFIVLAACLWLVAPVWQPSFAKALVAWGAVTLAFTGAVHWGAGLIEGDGPTPVGRYVYSVFPALLGWTVLMCPLGPAMFLLFCGLVASFMVDRRIFAGTQDWYVYLRALLTAIACACLYAGYKAIA